MSACFFRGGVEPDAGEQSDSLQGPLHRRERLIQERKLVEVNSNSAHIVTNLKNGNVCLFVSHMCTMFV